MAEQSVFNILNAVDVREHIEKKSGLSYLSWAWAWTEVKKRYPQAVYTIYERDTEHGPVNYFTDGRTCWVKTGVTIEGLEHIEELPVMDFRNKSIPYEAVTSMDVNKAIQRSLTKACARHGLGLFIYAGEDLPEGAEPEVQYASKPQIAVLLNYYKGENLTALLQANNINTINELPADKATELIRKLNEREERKNAKA